MKKLAARDYEDLLQVSIFLDMLLPILTVPQCSIPAFEGLLAKPHNKHLLKLLYRMAEWHAFAKLRMHTERTLEHLEKLTKELGLLMRQFRDTTCPEFETVELPWEVAARKWQEQRTSTQAKMSSAQYPYVFQTESDSMYSWHSQIILNCWPACHR
jgi:hypothetical protein